MSSRVSRLLPRISQFCGENALVLVTYMDGGSKQSLIFTSLRSREIKVDLRSEIRHITNAISRCKVITPLYKCVLAM